MIIPLISEAKTLHQGPFSVNELLLLPGGTILKHSGKGPKMARIAAKALVSAGATALVSWGTAGGLASELKPGHLIIPNRILTPDLRSFDTDTSWHESLRSHLETQVEISYGPITQSETILKGKEEKIDLYERSGALAVDMESAAVAQVALETDRPFMSIRAVVDPSDFILPVSALRATDDQGRLRPLSLLGSLAARPFDLLPLFRLSLLFYGARK